MAETFTGSFYPEAMQHSPLSVGQALRLFEHTLKGLLSANATMDLRTDGYTLERILLPRSRDVLLLREEGAPEFLREHASDYLRTHDDIFPGRAASADDPVIRFSARRGRSNWPVPYERNMAYDGKRFSFSAEGRMNFNAYERALQRILQPRR